MAVWPGVGEGLAIEGEAAGGDTAVGGGGPGAAGGPRGRQPAERPAERQQAAHRDGRRSVSPPSVIASVVTVSGLVPKLTVPPETVTVPIVRALPEEVVPG